MGMGKERSNEMYEVLGFGLTRKTLEVFGEKEKTVGWFYSKIPFWDYRRPYDVAKNGNLNEIEEELIRIDHGIFS